MELLFFLGTSKTLLGHTQILNKLNANKLLNPNTIKKKKRKKFDRGEENYAGPRTGGEDLALENPRGDVAASKHQSYEARERLMLLLLLLPTSKLKP